MTVIRGQRLTTFDVTPDGESFSLNVTDDKDRPATLVLPSDCLNELMMTLPEMVRRSLQARFHDASMRVVYPVGSWNVEPSINPASVVVTLRTPDGFAVSFGIPSAELFRMWTQSASINSDTSGPVGN